MLKFNRFEEEIVGDNINEFFSAKQIRENNEVPYYQSGTPRENYLRKIWSDYINLTWEIDRLKNVEVYFSVNKIPQHYINGGVSNLEYYNYHYEHFRIKSISIVDYLVLFINHCLQLGIPSQRCNIHSITNNTILKASKLVQSINDFNKDIINLRFDRNKIIHEGTFEPLSLIPLNDIILTYEESFINEDDLIMAKLKKEEIDKAIKHFISDIKMINEHVELILNNLIPYIKKQVEIFKISE